MTGQSVSSIARDCKVERSSLSSYQARNLKYFPPLSSDEWRIGLLKELIDIRDGKAVVPDLSNVEVKAMIEEICCN